MQMSFMKLGYKIILCAVALLKSAGSAYGEMPTETLTVVSYNILNGMKLDESPGKTAFQSWIQEKKPDVVGLQEAQNLTQAELEEWARGWDHPYAILLDDAPHGYPVAITSRYPIVNVRAVTKSMHHGFIAAEIAGINFVVTHLSPHKYWKRREEVDLLLATVANIRSGPDWVLMGDFNAESPQDRAMYEDGKLVIDRAAAEAKYSYHENLVNGELDFETIQRLLSAGFIDVVRRNTAGELSTQPTARYAQQAGRNTPRRVDYIFVSENLSEAAVDSRIMRDAFTDVYSDHYPVWLEVKR